MGLSIQDKYFENPIQCGKNIETVFVLMSNTECLMDLGKRAAKFDDGGLIFGSGQLLLLSELPLKQAQFKSGRN